METKTLNPLSDDVPVVTLQHRRYLSLGGASQPESEQSRLRVMSYNVLAPSTIEPHLFKEVRPEDLSVAKRFPLILRQANQGDRGGGPRHCFARRDSNPARVAGSMVPLQECSVMNNAAQEIAEEIFRRKLASRREAARLPIGEKLRILVEMQKRANEVRRATGRPEMFVWQLS